MAKKILVVDDERQVVRLVQVNLERAGYEVITAFNGKDALKKIELENPDLVILDVVMPKMDGIQVLKILLKNPATHELPVLMLTSKAADIGVFRDCQGPMVCYLTKPFNPMELISFVKRIFAVQEGSQANTVIPTPSSDGSSLPTS